MPDELYQVDNQTTPPTFCGGVTVRGDMIMQAAPILWYRAKRVCQGQHPRWSKFLAYCIRCGWKVTRA